MTDNNQRIVKLGIRKTSLTKASTTVVATITTSTITTPEHTPVMTYLAGNTTQEDRPDQGRRDVMTMTLRYVCIALNEHNEQ